VLVVILHGDAPFAKPSYQDTLAQRIAARYPEVVAVAILRPGYADPQGNTSDGVRGQTTGDNYNATNTDAIAAAIDRLRSTFHARRLILVGHSGGSAISANILGRHPALANAALLVSCPCDVTAWRAHMLAKTKFAGFGGPVVTLSPIDLVAKVSASVPVTMMVGDSDDVAPPALTRAYEARAKQLGKRVHVVMVHGGHEIFLRPEVLDELERLLR
jgi:pimeloyl-ACP methyl ester carboxylesterase